MVNKGDYTQRKKEWTALPVVLAELHMTVTGYYSTAEQYESLLRTKQRDVFNLSFVLANQVRLLRSVLGYPKQKHPPKYPSGFCSEPSSHSCREWTLGSIPSDVLNLCSLRRYGMLNLVPQIACNSYNLAEGSASTWGTIVINVFVSFKLHCHYSIMFI